MYLTDMYMFITDSLPIQYIIITASILRKYSAIRSSVQTISITSCYCAMRTGDDGDGQCERPLKDLLMSSQSDTKCAVNV